MTFGKLIEELNAKYDTQIEDAGGAFALEFDGQTVVLQLAGGRSGDILLAHADLGEVPPDRREALAASALEANFLYQGTGGATLAVNPRNGHLHIQKYNWLDRLDAEKAISDLTRFAETAHAWRKILESPRADPIAESHLMQV